MQEKHEAQPAVEKKLFPSVPYKRTPVHGWENDYCTAMNTPKVYAGQYINYEINSNTTVQVYYYPVPNQISLNIPTSNTSLFVQVLGQLVCLNVIDNISVSITDVEKNMNVLKKLAKNKLLDPAIIKDIEKSIPLRSVFSTNYKPAFF